MCLLFINSLVLPGLMASKNCWQKTTYNSMCHNRHIESLGHTLNLVISRKSETTIASTKVYPSIVSDHSGVRTTTHPPARHERKTRNIRGLDITEFAADLSLALDYTDNAVSGDGLLTHYEQTIQTALNTYAPLVSRIRQSRRCETWYDEHIYS